MEKSEEITCKLWDKVMDGLAEITSDFTVDEISVAAANTAARLVETTASIAAEGNGPSREELVGRFLFHFNNAMFGYAVAEIDRAETAKFQETEPQPTTEETPNA